MTEGAFGLLALSFAVGMVARYGMHRNGFVWFLSAMIFTPILVGFILLLAGEAD